MRNFANIIPDADTANVHVPAANTAAILTFAAVTGKRHHILDVVYSYSATPTGGRLTITDGGDTVFDIDIAAAGEKHLRLKLRGAENSAVVVTLAAGGGTVQGKLNVYKFTAPS